MSNTNFKDYIKEKIKLKPSLELEIKRAKSAVKTAHQIYKSRKEKGLTQKELAKIIGVSQSNIARIESADYGCYTMTTLNKVAAGLGLDLNIFITNPALTSKLLNTYSSPLIFQSFNSEGNFGDFSISGMGALNNENLFSMKDVTSNDNVRIIADSKKSKDEADNACRYQYL